MATIPVIALATQTMCTLIPEWDWMGTSARPFKIQFQSFAGFSGHDCYKISVGHMVSTTSNGIWHVVPTTAAWSLATVKLALGTWNGAQFSQNIHAHLKICRVRFWCFLPKKIQSWPWQHSNLTISSRQWQRTWSAPKGLGVDPRDSFCRRDLDKVWYILIFLIRVVPATYTVSCVKMGSMQILCKVASFCTSVQILTEKIWSQCHGRKINGNSFLRMFP